MITERFSQIVDSIGIPCFLEKAENVDPPFAVYMPTIQDLRTKAGVYGQKAEIECYIVCSTFPAVKDYVEKLKSNLPQTDCESASAISLKYINDDANGYWAASVQINFKIIKA